LQPPSVRCSPIAADRLAPSYYCREAVDGEGRHARGAERPAIVLGGQSVAYDDEAVADSSRPRGERRSAATPALA
jgi:hypothetical protein